MKSATVFIILFLNVFTAIAQPNPDTLWTTRIGGDNIDYCHAIGQTAEGGYILAGQTNSFGEHQSDAYLVKLNSTGGVQWSRTYGAISEFSGNSFTAVAQISNQGYILAGYTLINNWTYVYAVKTDADGDTAWTRVFWDPHATIDLSVHGVLETEDGGYLIAGYAAYSLPAHGYIFLIKTNSSGDTVWTRFMREREAIALEYCEAIIPSSDGGFVIAGRRYVESSNIVDGLLLKVSITGEVQWWRSYGYENYDAFSSLAETDDGGYILAGQSYVDDNRGTDVYVVRTTSSGDTIWTRRVGGNGEDVAVSVHETTDGFVVAGQTRSFGAGNADFYLMKLNANGEQLWSRTYGGSGWDYCDAMQLTSDGGYVLGGSTGSFGAQVYDVYVVKTGQDIAGGTCPPLCTDAYSIAVGDTVNMCSFQEQDDHHWYRVQLEAGSYRFQLNGFSESADYDVLTYFGCSDPIPTNCYGNAVGPEDFTCDFPEGGDLFLQVFVYEGPYGPYWLLVNRIVSTEPEDASIPKEFALSAYPNPFNPTTRIVFTLPQTVQVRLNVFDVTGRCVQALLDERFEAGRHEVRFDAYALPSGIYCARVEAGSFVRTQKLVLLK